MSKTHRVSVPLTPDLERQLRRLSAENGRSLAANFAALAQAGTENTMLEQRLTALRNELSGGRQMPEIVAEIRAEFSKIRADLEHLRPVASENRLAMDGVFTPEKPARLLFGEALFSAALSAQLANADMPGITPKPAGFHIRAAREKAAAQLAELLRGEA